MVYCWVGFSNTFHSHFPDLLCLWLWLLAWETPCWFLVVCLATFDRPLVHFPANLLLADRFIVDLARVLSDLLRGNDLVSRWGADEFAAVIEDTTREKALSIAERLRQAIAERTEGTMSIAMFYGVPGSPEDALKKADEALYRIKARGKNGIEMVE